MMRRVVARPNVHDLHQAICSSHKDTIAGILDQNCVNINGTVCGTTALSLTLYKEKQDLFELLLCHECARSRLDLNKLSKDEKQRVEPPLITACRLGNKAAAKLLILCGANLECVDNFQHTSLWMATRQRHTDLVKLILTNGASVNPSTQWTHSPLFFAVKYSSHRTEIAKILLYSGASVRVQSNSSLLLSAIIQGDINVAKLIVEAGYNVSTDFRLKEEYMGGNLSRNEELLSWLASEMGNPAPLQRQCRTQIRDSILSSCGGRQFLQHVVKLPLPKSILTYIALSDNAWTALE